MAATSADIGLIGLAVMGENLVLNMESHGYVVAVFNRTRARSMSSWPDGPRANASSVATPLRNWLRP